MKFVVKGSVTYPKEVELVQDENDVDVYVAGRRVAFLSEDGNFTFNVETLKAMGIKVLQNQL